MKEARTKEHIYYYVHVHCRKEKCIDYIVTVHHQLPEDVDDTKEFFMIMEMRVHHDYSDSYVRGYNYQEITHGAGAVV